MICEIILIQIKNLNKINKIFNIGGEIFYNLKDLTNKCKNFKIKFKSIFQF